MTESRNKKVLITGAYGFLGRQVVEKFRQENYVVYGIGRGDFDASEIKSLGMDVWHSASLSVQALQHFQQTWDVIVHCAGGSSVAKSLADPVQDFADTVNSTLQLVEFIRLYNPAAKLVYLSSAAVYGEHDLSPILVTDPLSPVSPYGLHKMLSEQICQAYQRMYAVNVTIIRFFSIYGPGLKKQLLWDACNKLKSTPAQVVFWGTGTETRDWIYINDAANLIYQCAVTVSAPLIINGASGQAHSVSDTLKELACQLAVPESAICFNGVIKAGDPRHYHADMKGAAAIGWRPTVSLEEGLCDYVRWFKGLHND